jgi:hypothetical protein
LIKAEEEQKIADEEQKKVKAIKFKLESVVELFRVLEDSGLDDEKLSKYSKELIKELMSESNADGISLLHRAILLRNAVSVQALLNHGADPFIKVKEKNALELAESLDLKGHQVWFHLMNRCNDDFKLFYRDIEKMVKAGEDVVNEATKLGFEDALRLWRNDKG